jgi:catechol 2,3-dioxygenase-like lactoylglutathione lyase family enzyme
MPLHRLTSITLGVPDVAAAAGYYGEFGLQQKQDLQFSTADGGQQLCLTHSARRSLLELGVGVDDPDDLDRIAAQLQDLGVDSSRTGESLRTYEPVAGFPVVVSVAQRYVQPAAEAVGQNQPGRTVRIDARAPGILREGMVRPRRLGHVVIGSVDLALTQRFFVEGIGFKISDVVKDFASFLRCSRDHHNLLVQTAPVNFLHHTAWEVDDIDSVGRGAMSMLEDHPERYGWGLGRHFLGSNFFWYLKDPAGNFSEYYSDMDCIVDDQLWKPGIWEGMKALYSWGPAPTQAFLNPEDLAGLMTGAHASRS